MGRFVEKPIGYNGEWQPRGSIHHETPWAFLGRDLERMCYAGLGACPLDTRMPMGKPHF